MAIGNRSYIFPVSPSFASVLNVKEVATYLRVHPSTIYKLLRTNKIPAFKIGADWRFNLDSIDQWRLRGENVADN